MWTKLAKVYKNEKRRIGTSDKCAETYRNSALLLNRSPDRPFRRSPDGTRKEPYRYQTDTRPKPDGIRRNQTDIRPKADEPDRTGESS